MTGPLRALLRRELALAARSGAALGTALGFALVVVTFVPLAVGPEPDLLARIAPGIIWIALLLAALLSVPRMFEADQQDGSLTVLSSAPVPLEAVVLVKIAAHWLTTALPLVLASPLLGVLSALPASAVPRLVASLLLGTPAVSAIGAIGAALTLMASRGGLLISVIVLPLYVPVLIFGLSVMDAAAPIGTTLSAAAITGAISLAAIVLAPFAAAAALRARLAG